MNKRGIYILALLAVILFPRYAAPEDVRRYTLNELINIAVEKNPSVALFRANLAAARGVVISEAAYPNPELEVEGARGESLDGQESRDEYSVSIAQPIEWPGKRSFRRSLLFQGRGTSQEVRNPVPSIALTWMESSLSTQK